MGHTSQCASRQGGTCDCGFAALLAAQETATAPQTTLALCVNDTCLYSCADDECKKAAEKGIPWPAPQTDGALEALLKDTHVFTAGYIHRNPSKSFELIKSLAAALRQLLSDQSATDKEQFKACVSGYIAGVQDYRDDSVDAVQLRLNAIQEAELQFPAKGNGRPPREALLSATEEAAFKAGWVARHEFARDATKAPGLADALAAYRAGSVK